MDILVIVGLVLAFINPVIGGVLVGYIVWLDDPNTGLQLMMLSLTGCAVSNKPVADQTAAAAAFIRDPASVTGTTWTWVSTVTPVDRIDAPEPGRYTIRFQPDGKLVARFDCNRGGGDYEISEGKLTIGPLISTRMACPEGSLDATFTRDLGRVTSFFVRDESLYLELPFDSGTMQFRKSDP